MTWRVALTICVAMFVCACGPQPAPEASPAPPAATVPSDNGAWARATPEGVRIAAGYLTLRNETDAVRRVIAAASPRATRVELHSMTMDGDVMRMRKLDGLDVPARGETVLAPGGNHLMFIEIDRPFAAGEAVPVTLTYADGATAEVTLSVRAPSPTGGDDPHAGH